MILRINVNDDVDLEDVKNMCRDFEFTKDPVNPKTFPAYLVAHVDQFSEVVPLIDNLQFRFAFQVSFGGL